MHYYSLEIVLNQVLIMLVFVKVNAKFLRMFQGQNFSGTYKPTRKKKTRIQYFAIQIIKPTTLFIRLVLFQLHCSITLNNTHTYY